MKMLRTLLILVEFSCLCTASITYAEAGNLSSKVISGYIVKRGSNYFWTDSPRAFKAGLKIRFKTGFDVSKRVCVFTEYHRCDAQIFKVGKVIDEKKGYTLVDAEPISELNNAKLDRLLSSFK